MKLLKNERAYRAWSTGKDGWDTYKDRFRTEAPTEYPCYAYLVVQSFGYEEVAPQYLYSSDVEMMMQELQRAGA